MKAHYLTWKKKLRSELTTWKSRSIFQPRINGEYSTDFSTKKGQLNLFLYIFAIWWPCTKTWLMQTCGENNWCCFSNAKPTQAPFFSYEKWWVFNFLTFFSVHYECVCSCWNLYHPNFSLIFFSCILQLRNTHKKSFFSFLFVHATMIVLQCCVRSQSVAMYLS